jgi:membrane associated rhomboid family serine protease
MSFKSSIQKFHIPPYNRNAVIQLIAFSGVSFVAVHLVCITLIVYAVPESRAYQLTFEYVGMGTLNRISHRWWTVFSYGWCHRSFWEWLSNMLWLYCFGNVVQNLLGYKQIIPIFVYSILFGGLAFAGIQFFPSATLNDTTLVMGAQAGVFGLMAAALTISPKYRIYLSEYFSVPLMLLAGIFTVLMVVNSDFQLTNIAMLLAAAVVGVVYIKLLQSGYQPGAWAYKWYTKMDASFSPKENYKPIKDKTEREKLVDKILDKINEKGYEALSKSEKDILKETNR